MHTTYDTQPHPNQRAKNTKTNGLIATIIATMLATTLIAAAATASSTSSSFQSNPRPLETTVRGDVSFLGGPGGSLRAVGSGGVRSAGRGVRGMVVRRGQLRGQLRGRLQREKSEMSVEMMSSMGEIGARRASSRRASSRRASSTKTAVSIKPEMPESGGSEQVEDYLQKFEEIRTNKPAVIIGTGVSGLACAKLLKQKNFNITILEASDGIGGRVRSDVIDGFTLDRGFQVFLDEYPDVQKYFREAGLEKLKLKKFLPGALVYTDGQFSRVSDPIRRPLDLPASLLSSVGSIADKLKVGSLRIFAGLAGMEVLMKEPETTTYQYLSSKQGLSDDIIDKFFRPFYRGIYLAELENQSSRMFSFVFKMLADGSACLPESGMGEITRQMAEGLEDDIRLNCPVAKVEPGKVTLNSGEEIEASYIVCATDGKTASEILKGQGKKEIPCPDDRRSLCYYYSIDGPAPMQEPILFLNGEAVTHDTPVNNVAFLTNVNPSLAPAGKSLASVTVVDPQKSAEELEPQVRKQMAKWFGSGAEKWNLLKTYPISGAQPGQTPPNTFEKDLQICDGVWCCGDHMDTPTLNGALRTGVKTADEVAMARGLKRKAILEKALARLK